MQTSAAVEDLVPSGSFTEQAWVARRGTRWILAPRAGAPEAASPLITAATAHATSGVGEERHTTVGAGPGTEDDDDDYPGVYTDSSDDDDVARCSRPALVPPLREALAP